MKTQITLLLFILSLSVSAQSVIVKQIAEFPLEADRFIGVDDYGSQYYIQGNTLFKKSKDNTYQYIALQLGSLSTVDILNPLKITAFYQASNTAVILDNTLSEIKRISFSNIDNFRNVSHATTANDRRLWIYNIDLQQLEIFDYNTQRIIQASRPITISPEAMTSNFNFCWLLTPSSMSRFNNYGSFLESIPVTELQTLRQYNGYLLSWDGIDFKYKRPNQVEFQKIEIPKIPVKQFSLNNEILYIYDGRKVTSFQLKQAKD
tara:strand:+ start:56955 stop:57740 length:786 start_codon:yes stop_codon:yes gene_type:complete